MNALLEVVHQLQWIVSFLLCAFVGPALATGFLLWRKRLARARRRSPIGRDILRGPGHSLRDKMDEKNSDLMADMFGLVFLPVLVLAVFLLQSAQRGLAAMLPLAPIYSVVTVVVVAFMIWRLVRTAGRLDQLRAGFDAELAVGQEVDQLLRGGAYVFHDFPPEQFNVDHVVIAPEGVFAIETKGYTKPNRGKGKDDARVRFDGKCLQFPTWTTTEPLVQAKRQAAWLEKWLTSAVGDPVKVTPVLALPGWYVERGGWGDVRVFSGRELSGLLKSRGATPLSAQEMQRIAHQVDQRCRDVSPKYAPAASAK